MAKESSVRREFYLVVFLFALLQLSSLSKLNVAAQVNYKGLYVVDRQRIGNPDCQENLVRAWAEAQEGPLASFAGKVLDITIPNRVYGVALDWASRDNGHEFGQIHRPRSRLKKWDMVVHAKLEMQPVACLDPDCNLATLILLHNRNEDLNYTEGHQAWLVDAEDKGVIFQSTMPANIAWYDGAYFANRGGDTTVVKVGAETEVRMLSGTTWGPCGRGISVPISWNSLTSEDTDTVCVRDNQGNAALIGGALELGSILNPPNNVTIVSNPVLCKGADVYVDFGNETNMFTTYGGNPFLSCSYSNSSFLSLLQSALNEGNLTRLQEENLRNFRENTNCSNVNRMQAALKGNIANQGGRLFTYIHNNSISKMPYTEPVSQPGIQMCYGSWAYPNSLCDQQSPNNTECETVLSVTFYDVVLDFTASILFDQAILLALAQKKLELPSNNGLFGIVATILLALAAAVGAIPGARIFVIAITTWIPSEVVRQVLVFAAVVAIGIMTASSVWALLFGITQYISASYYYIPVSTQLTSSVTQQPVFFIGFVTAEVRGTQAMYLTVIFGGVAVTVLVVIVALCGCLINVHKQRYLQIPYQRTGHHPRWLLHLYHLCTACKWSDAELKRPTFPYHDNFGAAETMDEMDIKLLKDIQAIFREMDQIGTDVTTLQDVMTQMKRDQALASNIIFGENMARSEEVDVVVHHLGSMAPMAAIN